MQSRSPENTQPKSSDAGYSSVLQNMRGKSQKVNMNQRLRSAAYAS